CGVACNGDPDCTRGARCLKTDTGTACVDSSAATCEAGCPEGTTCNPADGTCRNMCDTTECLPGQTCQGALCFGTAKHEAGSGGSGGTTSMANAGAGAGGAGQTDS